MPVASGRCGETMPSPLHHHDLPGAGHSGIGYEVNPAEPLADATANQVGHLGQCVAWAIEKNRNPHLTFADDYPPRPLPKRPRLSVTDLLRQSVDHGKA